MGHVKHLECSKSSISLLIISSAKVQVIKESLPKLVPYLLPGPNFSPIPHPHPTNHTILHIKQLQILLAKLPYLHDFLPRLLQPNTSTHIQHLLSGLEFIASTTKPPSSPNHHNSDLPRETHHNRISDRESCMKDEYRHSNFHYDRSGRESTAVMARLSIYVHPARSLSIRIRAVAQDCPVF